MPQLDATGRVPLSVHVLRFYPEDKDDATRTTLKKQRFVYEIETCHQATGEVYRTERRFREFIRLREALLEECRGCKQCQPFVERLDKSKLPTRGFLVMDLKKYGATRAVELTAFLQELVRIVAKHARYCQVDGPDIDKSVGLFLGLKSLKDAEDAVMASQDLIAPVLKTRQERIDFRGNSMPELRMSTRSMPDASSADEQFRARGMSDLTHVRR